MKKYNKTGKKFKTDAQRKKHLKNEHGIETVKDHKGRDCVAEEVGVQMLQGKRLAAKRERQVDGDSNAEVKAKFSKLASDLDKSDKVTTKDQVEALEEEAEKDEDDDGSDDGGGSGEESERESSDSLGLQSSSSSKQRKSKAKGSKKTQQRRASATRPATATAKRFAGAKASGLRASKPDKARGKELDAIALSHIEKGKEIQTSLFELTPPVMWKSMLNPSKRLAKAVDFETEIASFLASSLSLNEPAKQELKDIHSSISARATSLNAFQDYIKFAKSSPGVEAVTEIKELGSMNSMLRALLPYLAEHLPMVLQYWGKRLLELAPEILLDFIQLGPESTCAFHFGLILTWNADSILYLCTAQQNITNELFIKLRASGSDQLAEKIFSEAWQGKIVDKEFMNAVKWFPPPSTDMAKIGEYQQKLPLTSPVGIDFQKVIACLMQKADKKDVDPAWVKQVAASTLFSNTLNLCVSSSPELRCTQL